MGGISDDSEIIGCFPVPYAKNVLAVSDLVDDLETAYDRINPFSQRIERQDHILIIQSDGGSAAGETYWRGIVKTSNGVENIVAV